MSDGITCRICGKGTSKDCRLHHIIPRCIGGKDTDGRVYLCKRCHDINHNNLPKIIWKFVPDEKKEECKEAIRSDISKWLS